MFLVQWNGSLVDAWLDKTKKEQTTFILCPVCWDNIAFGDLSGEEKLLPKNGDPQDKYLEVLDEEATGVCCLCRSSR